MPVRFFYIDESYNKEVFCLSAIAIRHSQWKECFDEVRAKRVQLKRDHGIFLRKEIHARDFVKGKGHISDQVIPKWTRTRIFHGLLRLVAGLPSVQIYNICLPYRGLRDAQMTAWDRITNRIERTERERESTEFPLRSALSDVVKAADIPQEKSEQVENRLKIYRARAFIIADEGRESEITTAIRRMHVYNPIPSRFGAWSPGEVTKNITTERLIEDPVFKESHRSYFLQLADCVSFALLKRESTPTPHVLRYELHRMFDETVASVCFTKASSRDKLGIVRK